jgi:predicted MFS family arabinose efflux permease
MLMVINLALASVSLLTALLVATHTLQLWNLLALAFVIAILGVSQITASQTIIVDIVPRAQLLGANALYSAAANLALVIGPALAGIFLARAGVEYAFYFSTLLYIGSAVTARRIRVKMERHGEGKAVASIWQELRGGVHYVAQTPVLQWLLLLGISAIAVGVWFTLVPRFARDFLESGATGYGAILSARGIGGLIGVIALIAAGRIRRLSPILLACALAFAMLVILFAFSSSMTLATILAFGLGIVFIWWPSTLRTAFQLSATDEMRGRVMSLFALVGQILTLGWLVGGMLSEAIGPQAAMILTAILCVGINVLAFASSPVLRAIGRDEE